MEKEKSKEKNTLLESLTPQKIVKELDKYIIGQGEAKKSVAIALRNRYRRQQVKEEMQEDITPKNIIMMGPTGVGKTEVARRLAKLVDAPFVKVESTKFTEVGYVGRDVESIIRDLISVAVNGEKKKMLKTVEKEALKQANEIILSILFPQGNNNNFHQSEKRSQQNNFSMTLDIKDDKNEEKKNDEERERINRTREKIKKKLENGGCEDTEIEINVPKKNSGFPSFNVMGVDPSMGFEQMEGMMQNLFNSMKGNKNSHKKVKVKDARKILKEDIADQLVDMEKVVSIATEKTEKMGIVFLDEIDKIASSQHKGADVSREGVQRDILPLVEGSAVNTKYGVIKTNHILFISAGAFHISSPNDLIPELQGRFPIRVQLESLSVEDLQLVLTQPKNSLIKQYSALLKTEGIEIDFDKKAVSRIAEIAQECNTETQNTGARRLATVVEKLLEDLLFKASDLKNKKVKIDEKYVNDKLGKIIEKNDIKKYIL